MKLNFQNGQKKLYAFYLISFIFLAIYANGNIFHPNHIYDDEGFLVKHTALYQKSILKIFTTNYWGPVIPKDPLYRPIPVLLLKTQAWLNLQMGLEAHHSFIFKLGNLVLHTLFSILCFYLIRSLGFCKITSIITVAIFFIHPLHREVLNSVVARAESLAGIFSILFLFFHRNHKIVFAALCILLTLLSKESGLAMLFFCILISGKQNIKIKTAVPYLIPLMIWVALRQYSLDPKHALDVAPLNNPLFDISSSDRYITALYIQLKYIWNSILPLHIFFDYSGKTIQVLQGILPTLSTFFFFLILVIFLAFYKKSRVLLILYVFTAITTSNLLFPIGTVMASRLFYIPSIAFIILLVFTMRKLKYSSIFFLSYILFLSIQSHTLNQVWYGKSTFWSYHSDHQPLNSRAHFYMGFEMYEQEQYEKSLLYFDRSINVDPDLWEAYFIKGKSLTILNRLDEAKKCLDIAYKKHPTSAQLIFSLAHVFHLKKELKQAAIYYSKALKLKMGYAEAWKNLAAIYQAWGDIPNMKGCLENYRKLKQLKK